ncbi:MAG: leucyl aminopeptidase family protein [Rubrimonas sp.]
MHPCFAASDAADAVPLRLIRPSAMDAASAELSPGQARWLAASGFKGGAGEAVALPDENGAPAAAMIGLGEAPVRFAAAAAIDRLPPGVYRLDGAAGSEAVEEAALGWLLHGYRFDRYREAQPAARLLTAPDGAARLTAIAEGVFLARDLINTPACDMGPEEIEAVSRSLATRFGAQVRTVVGDDLLLQNLPLVHAVGRAAEQAPRLIELRWGDEGAPRVTLVGKGVCFDTGGLDIKPSASMRLMKKDMGGAAAALGLARMIMALNLPVRLRVLIPAVENAVGPLAFRPGDILRSRKGLTVEIGNTDAEGRLVLADALALACEERPGLLVDFATLTGAARVALGPELPALFTDDDALAAELAEAGLRAGDPMWRLPLWPGYEDDLKSPVADIDNAPAGGFAGAITAALFLKRFVEPGVAWAHVDLYGWNPAAKPGRPKGGECQTARAILSLLETRHG